MKHRKAEEWDSKHGKEVDKHEVASGKYVPVNRPCDRCGETVERGYIHRFCQEEERKFWLEVFYD